MRAAAAAGALAPDLPPSSPAQAPCPSEPSCPRTPCWVQNWHSGERPEAWPTEPRSRGRWHRASGLTVPEPGGGCAQLSSSPNFKRQRIIFLSVASKVRWKIKLLKKKSGLCRQGGGEGLLSPPVPVTREGQGNRSLTRGRGRKARGQSGTRSRPKRRGEAQRDPKTAAGGRGARGREAAWPPAFPASGLHKPM